MRTTTTVPLEDMMKKLLIGAVMMVATDAFCLELAISPLLLVKADGCAVVPADQTPGRTEVECTLRNYSQATVGTLFRLVAISADGKEVQPSTNVGELEPAKPRKYRIVIANGDVVGTRVEVRERSLFGRD
ncbi:hypothetical protein BWI17_15440 [Betaproteobacteria bacterium GR16-43]|nr:hypothetical protein BWI17_15440 [Betaproteobacteria bacterium GR16-43]